MGMGEGRIDRTSRARTSEFKALGADLKERIPELRERIPDLKDRLPNELGSQLRTKGTEFGRKGSELARQYAKMDVAWARGGMARGLRQMLLSFGLRPLMEYYTNLKVNGREVFDREELNEDRPVIFVANHSSHLDTPTILRAIPIYWRSRTAVAAAADYFYKSRWKANGVALLFNTVPLGRNGGGLGNGATDHVDRLIEDRWNLLMYPEGTRSRDGSIGKIRSGAAVLAAQHRIPIVPIYVGGTYDAMPAGQNWPKRKLFSRRHKLEVRFGEPIPVADPSERREAMEQVRAFWERKGMPERKPEPAPAHNVLLIHEVLRAHEHNGVHDIESVLPAHAA
jgi:1-acyl-sn-glycerol-3-phosphate acyltransferase